MEGKAERQLHLTGSSTSPVTLSCFHHRRRGGGWVGGGGCCLLQQSLSPPVAPAFFCPPPPPPLPSLQPFPTPFQSLLLCLQPLCPCLLAGPSSKAEPSCDIVCHCWITALAPRHETCRRHRGGDPRGMRSAPPLGYRPLGEKNNFTDKVRYLKPKLSLRDAGLSDFPNVSDV